MKKFLISLIVVVGFSLYLTSIAAGDPPLPEPPTQYSAINCRKHTASLTDFGGIGDGKTLNTQAFKSAIGNLSKLAADGGAQLLVPPGKWLTGAFDLTSHFTLFLDKDAVILGSQEEGDYPLIDPLPSYGQGRDGPGKRFSSLIGGTNLTDVVITGGNGTIDGQGEVWWKKFRGKQLNNSRGYLIELLFSNQVQISNLTLKNSPSWNVHPTYCTDVIIEHLTVLAPVDSPNTDGINPDSCSNVRIRDSFVVSGDDCISVKSGWDNFGIKVGLPSQHISIKRFTCISPDSATIALGSEMSGGIQDVRAEEVYAISTESGIRVKTAPGRGAYIKDIYARDFHIDTMKYIFWATGAYGQHPGNNFDPKALPEVKNLNYKNFVAKNVTYVGSLSGIEGDPFTGFCISNVTATLAEKKTKKLIVEDDDEEDLLDFGEVLAKKGKLPWNCTDITGVTSNVTPPACSLLPEKAVECPFPTDVLPIDEVELKTCSIGAASRRLIFDGEFVDDEN